MALFFCRPYNMIIYINIDRRRIVPDCSTQCLYDFVGRRTWIVIIITTIQERWLRENNSEMKPIWFSLFDFYTAAERRRGGVALGRGGRGGRSSSTHHHRRSSSDRPGPHNPVTLGVTPRLHRASVYYNIAPKTPGRDTEIPYCQSHWRRRRRNASWLPYPATDLKTGRGGSDDTRFFARMRGPAPHRCRTDALVSTCRRRSFESCTKLYGIIIILYSSVVVVVR